MKVWGFFFGFVGVSLEFVLMFFFIIFIIYGYRYWKGLL